MAASAARRVDFMGMGMGMAASAFSVAMVRDARCCRAPHHEDLRPHPEERALARVSKDEATELETR
jgi:hypothetical protein